MNNIKHYWRKLRQAISGFALPRTRRLECELSAAVEKNRLLASELGDLRSEFERARDQEKGLIAGFGQRITAIESERDLAHRQLRDLGQHLKEATARQESAAREIRRLESRLKEEHHRSESALETLQLTLTQVRHEQQGLSESQSELGDLLGKTRQHLLEVIQAGSARPHTHAVAVSFIAVLFLLNTLTGAASIWIFRQDLAEVSALTSDLKLSIGEHIKAHTAAREEQPVQAGIQVSREANEKAGAASVSEHSRGEWPGADPRDAQQAGSMAGSHAATATRAVSAGDAGAEPAEQALPGPQQLAINGYTPQPRYRADTWGPPLLLPVPEEQDQGDDGASGFDPLVRELQSNLLVLGFSLGQDGADGYRGRYTRQALREFQILYEPVFRTEPGLAADNLAAQVRHYAVLALEDERKYKIASEILSAIRLSHMRTGVDFSFLMELAAAESTFNPGSRAAASSAAGLYQFKRDTWLDTVKRHGRKYGLGHYAKQVEFIVDDGGKRRPVINDSDVYEHVLDLRYNPRLSALMAAEYLKGNLRQLSLSLDQEPGRTEAYLTHFLGLSGAITFLELLDKHPHRLASDIFPGPASRNNNIFRNEDKKPRTVAEVYDVLGRKFSDARYRDWRGE